MKYFLKIKQVFLLLIRGSGNNKYNKPTENKSRESGEKEKKRIWREMKVVCVQLVKLERLLFLDHRKER